MVFGVMFSFLSLAATLGKRVMCSFSNDFNKPGRISANRVSALSIFSDALPSFITRVYLLTGITIISFLFIIITFNDIFYK